MKKSTLSRSGRRMAAALATVVLVAGLLAAMNAWLGAPSGPPLDPAIPNEGLLVARGLSGTPGPGQPHAPIAVDRVVTDGADTYVQFHMTGPLRPSIAPLPMLYDDSGTMVNYGGGASFSPTGWTLPLPSWVHWQLPVTIRGHAELGPLPPTARAAVLRFTNGETVRVPLNLAALRHSRVYRGRLVQRNGWQVQITEARDTSVVVGFAPFGDPQGAVLKDAHGRSVPLWTMGSECGNGGFADAPLSCRSVWSYPLQRHGARLTLAIQSFTGQPPGTAGVGPWRLMLVIP